MSFRRIRKVYRLLLNLVESVTVCSNENNFPETMFGGIQNEEASNSIGRDRWTTRPDFSDFHFKEWITRHMAASWNIDELISFGDWPYALIFNPCLWVFESLIFSLNEIILATRVILTFVGDDKVNWRDGQKLGRMNYFVHQLLTVILCEKVNVLFGKLPINRCNILCKTLLRWLKSVPPFRENWRK